MLYFYEQRSRQTAHSRPSIITICFVFDNYFSLH